MPDTTRDRYLATLAEQLPFPAGRRAELVEEINAHLEDAVRERVSHGVDADRAERDAQARLGPPATLAAELARPEQSVRRAFAAAGAGVVAAVGPWVYGYLVGILIVLGSMLGVALTVGAVSNALSLELTFSTSGAWTTLLTVPGFALGLYLAGRAMTDAVSVTSRRLRGQVRPWVAVPGTAVAFAILTLAGDAPQNAASVLALIVAPFAFAVGVYRPDLLPRRHPVSLLVLLIVLAISIALMAALAFAGANSTSVTTTASVSTEEWTAAEMDDGTSVIGPRWFELDGRPALMSSGWSGGSDATDASWEFEPGTLRGLRDLRAEAWAADASAPWRLDSAAESPFLVAPVDRIGSVFSAELDTTSQLHSGYWMLVLTGVGPDGVRYVVDASGAGTTEFHGSAWEWIVAVAR